MKKSLILLMIVAAVVANSSGVYYGGTAGKIPVKYDEPEKVKVDVRNQCVECHIKFDFLKMNNVHKPVSFWDCYACHEENQPNRNEHGGLVLEMDHLCFTCHVQEVSEMGLKVGHKPFKDMKCLDCHDPHATGNPNLLKKKVPSLCLDCHDMKDEKVSHEPYAIGNCTGCHVPHASDNKGLTLKPENKLCLNCHETKSSMPSQHKPVQDELCMDCHTPHTSDTIKILRKPVTNLCADCHDSYVSSLTERQHADSGDCLACHVGHTSQDSPLLKSEAVSLCKSCHLESSKLMTHPVGESYKDPNGGYMRCSSCHNPHGTENVLMFKSRGDKVCTDCHGKMKSE